MKIFFLCFVPLFVAMDGIGLVPFFLGLMEGQPRDKIRKVIIQSLVTATIIITLFVYFGMSLLSMLGISVYNFLVAGGVLLFIIALKEIIDTHPSSAKPTDTGTLGAVPIGIPLIAGPAVLTTSVLLSNQYGHTVTMSAIMANILIVGIFLWFAVPISKCLGSAGTKAVSKIASFILASIAVQFIYDGLRQLLITLPK